MFFVAFFDFQQNQFCPVLQNGFAVSALDPCAPDVVAAAFHRRHAAHLPFMPTHRVVRENDEVVDAQILFCRSPL